MNRQTNNKDIALARFLSWPKDAREAYLELRFPQMTSAIRLALLREPAREPQQISFAFSYAA